jgi:hypothetical protein
MFEVNKKHSIIGMFRCVGREGGLPPAEGGSGLNKKYFQFGNIFWWGERGSNPHNVTIDGF